MLAPSKKPQHLYLVRSPAKVLKVTHVVDPPPRASVKQDKRGRQAELVLERPTALDSYEKRMRWIFQEARKRHNLPSQNALADKCKIDSGQFSRLITRKDTIALKFFTQFVTETRANPTYIIFGIGDDFI